MLPAVLDVWGERREIPPRKSGRIASVQVWLDSDLQKEAKISLELAAMTWQDLLEQYVRGLVRTRRAKHRGQALQKLATS
jgi:hypothetical protein